MEQCWSSFMPARFSPSSNHIHDLSFRRTSDVSPTFTNVVYLNGDEMTAGNSMDNIWNMSQSPALLSNSWNGRGRDAVMRDAEMLLMTA